MTSEDQIEVVGLPSSGYKPLVDYDHWRVAVLRYCEELDLPNLKTMQRHNETDEVFVLLEGSCVLFAGGDQKLPAKFSAVRMEPLKVYNVKKGVWHTHTLTPNSSVLIVENRDTTAANSPTKELTLEDQQDLQDIFHRFV